MNMTVLTIQTFVVYCRGMFVNVVQNKALQGELLQVCTRLQEHEKAIENFKRSNYLF